MARKERCFSGGLRNGGCHCRNLGFSEKCVSNLYSKNQAPKDTYPGCLEEGFVWEKGGISST